MRHVARLVSGSRSHRLTDNQAHGKDELRSLHRGVVIVFPLAGTGFNTIYE